MRVAIYARVSTKNKGQDIEMQLSELRSYAQQRGWQIVAEYTDIGISGAKESRPGLDRLMTATAQIDAILVWKLDRFARSLKHLVNAVSELEARGIAFVSLRDSIDLSTPAGRFMFQIIGAMAEFERSLIQERVRCGIKHAQSKGVKFGPKFKATDNHQLRVLQSQGLSLRDIAREANTSLGTVYRRLSA